ATGGVVAEEGEGRKGRIGGAGFDESLPQVREAPCVRDRLRDLQDHPQGARSGDELVLRQRREIVFAAGFAQERHPPKLFLSGLSGASCIHSYTCINTCAVAVDTTPSGSAGADNARAGASGPFAGARDVPP